MMDEMDVDSVSSMNNVGPSVPNPIQRAKQIPGSSIKRGPARLETNLINYRSGSYTISSHPELQDYVLQKRMELHEHRFIFKRDPTKKTNQLVSLHRTAEDTVVFTWNVSFHPAQEAHKHPSEYAVLTVPRLLFNDYSLSVVYYDSEVLFYARGIEKYFQLYGKVSIEQSSHRGQCHCSDTGLSCHALAFIPAICTKASSELRPDDFAIIQQAKVSAECNHTHVYRRTPRDRSRLQFRLQVPMPFPLNIGWKPLDFEPAFSSESLGEALTKFVYALISKENVRHVTMLYSESPDCWDIQHNPIIMKPPAGSELAEVTKKLYGIETIPRVTLTVHPNALKEACFLSTLDNNLTYKKGQISDPAYIEKTTLLIHQKALFDVKNQDGSPMQMGLYAFSCPLCMPQMSSNLKVNYLPTFTRSSYLEHYSDFHAGSSVLIGSWIETGLNIRIYEAFVLYLACLTMQTFVSREMKGTDLPVPDLDTNTELTRAFGVKFPTSFTEANSSGSSQAANMLPAANLSYGSGMDIVNLEPVQGSAALRDTKPLTRGKPTRKETDTAIVSILQTK